MDAAYDAAPVFAALYVFTMIRYLVLLLFFSPSVVSAKCKTEYHEVSGSLLKQETKFINAKVTVEFYDGLKQRVSNSTLTDKNGNFSIELTYNLYSGRGMFAGDKCNFHLDHLQLTIEGDGFEAYEDQIEATNGKTTYNKHFK